MTDGKMVKMMARIYRLNEQILGLLEDLSDHPNGEALVADVHDNGVGYSWDFASIAHSHLVHPDRWECSHRGPLRWKAADAAGGES